MLLPVEHADLRLLSLRWHSALRPLYHVANSLLNALPLCTRRDDHRFLLLYDGGEEVEEVGLHE